MSYSIVYEVRLLSVNAYSLCVLFCGLNILATQDIVAEKYSRQKHFEEVTYPQIIINESQIISELLYVNNSLL